MKQKLIAGNWKMHTTAFEAGRLAESIATKVMSLMAQSEVLLCPPYTSLQTVSEVVSNTKVKLGAQNCHSQPEGAYTGEISIPMLRYLDCGYVILGHSERRRYFNETDDSVNEKLRAVVNSRMNAIVCIGEKLKEREGGEAKEVIKKQLEEALKNIDDEYSRYITIAYEPVWAIGTGVSAEPEQVEDAHSLIRKELLDKYGEEGEKIRILYGGSMKESNAADLLSLNNVDGGLIGGASLKAKSFLAIIEIAEEILKER